ncbi:hypothetical protein BDP55DRAFT_544336 [Colletotrichum godetiae]|uniref:Nucleoside phosphorylase domain-containing protein n=1 Tax=Colletotrichum godetiae TaxID=1209918 RepID=A0AAJ0ATN6_9PEZI|nr:uncharacterized protein BDP55DRAFT_544336 [Colletotrichum godetiae]KAK1690156.1 hypothetical protein BDP55DRAFT_544336 [Colletotrichum godetiae]
MTDVSNVGRARTKNESRGLSDRSLPATYRHDQYTVGWICALAEEQTAAIAMLDKEYPNLPQANNDYNTYTLGSIWGHNIVIACLPKGMYGVVPAATVATRMLATFPAIKFGLMVGIGGGIPPKVRLGDIVVGSPTDKFPGVVQWDLGKDEEGGTFKRKGALNNPPMLLSTALQKLDSRHELRGSKVAQYLEEMVERYPSLKEQYGKSDKREDRLFKTGYPHTTGVRRTAEGKANGDGEGGSGSILEAEQEEEEENEEEGCPNCDRDMIRIREPRETKVHYGLIASGNRVIKDAIKRDQLKEDLGADVLCVEMEAAGLVNNFPCLVIRGICDYADSHKNDIWHKHAAASAAAFAKELLEYVTPENVSQAPTALEQLPVHQMTSTMNEKVIQSERRAKDQKLLDWISRAQYGFQQSDALRRRQEGTVEWFLKSEEYQSWLSSTGITLFCPGIPGAGKTVLTSVVVDHLFTKFTADDGVGIAYLYCKSRTRSSQTLETLLSSLLKQLLTRVSSRRWPKSLRDLHQKYAIQGLDARPLPDELRQELKRISRAFTRVFIIVDALDECQPRSCQSRLLQILSSLETKTMVRINILVTSRPLPGIEKDLFNHIRVDIEAHEEDIRRYTRSNLTEIQDLVDNAPGLERQITDRVASSASGMFLLAKLYVGYLQGATSERKILSALEKFRQDRSLTEDHLYDKAYDAIMTKIENQKKLHKDLAKKVISWITHTNRPLEAVELQQALAVDLEDSKLDLKSIPDVNMMLSVCAGLVITEKNGRIITLVHYTAYEYFQRRKVQYFRGGHGYMTSTCIKYLTFAIQARLTLSQLHRQYPFFLHAVFAWGFHAAQATPLQSDVISFLEDDHTLQRLCLMVPGDYPSTGIELAALYGISDAIRHFHSRAHAIDSPQSQGRTPLYYASAGGHHRTTPLVTAAKLGHFDTAKTLLLGGAYVDARSDFHHHRTPLAFAVAQGRLDLVSLFLEHGASINVLDEDALTPVAIASRENQASIVKLLVEERPDTRLDTIDAKGHSPLSFAAMRGDLDMLQLLSDKGALIDFPTQGNLTPLSVACRHGQYAVADFLIQRKASVHARDTKGRTPLSWACEAEVASTGLIELLLDHDAEAEIQDHNGRTPLSYACSTSKGHGMAEVLIRKGARLDTTDGSDRSPLSRACSSGIASIELIKLLLDSGAEVESPDKNRRTPLFHAASTFSQPDIVELLVSKGASMEVQDRFGQTAVGIATQHGHHDVARLLKRMTDESQTEGWLEVRRLGSPGEGGWV